MAEKRFNTKQSSIIDNCSVIIDSESEYGFPTLESTLNSMFCKALNELAEENTRLKHTNQELYDKLQVTMSEKSLKGGEIAILERENKQLKSINQDHKDHLADFYADYDRLEKENEQLKKQIGNLEHTRDFCAECCDRLEKENEELKSKIRKVEREYTQLWMHTYK